MAAFQKLGDYTNGTANDGSEVTTEYNNIYEAFNGTSSDKEMERKLSHATKAPMIHNQTGAGDLGDFQLSGVKKVTVQNSGKIKSTVSTGTAPIDVDSTTKCPNVNADKLDDLEGADYAQLSSARTRESKTFFYPVLPAAVESVESVGRWIIPAGQDITIEDITSVWAAGADSAASNIFTIKRRNAAGTLQTDVGTVDVNDQGKDVLNVSDPADVPLTAGDQVYPLYTTRNVATETLVSITVRYFQKLKTT